ncbi:MAG: pyrroline-5-carboxylate reductase [Pseudomonadota bacterium]|nr:pyrroline-5-carboxylate reductase [Pseudomonadota bacterium]
MKPLITLIGCGKMGSAMLHGWLADPQLDADFAIIEPMADHLAWTDSHDNVRVHASIADAAARENPARMIVLAVKPQMMDEAIDGLGALVGAETAFLSIAAGIPTGWFRARLGAEAMVLRSMPNTPAAIGRGVTALFAGHAPAELVSLATTLLSAVGTVVMLEDEALMDAVTALSGSGPAYVFLLAEAMTAAGIKAGLPADLAGQLAEATVSGAGALIAESDEPPSQLRVNVTSKGGTTAAALAVLMAEAGLEELMTRAILAARDRSVELGG